MAPTEQIELRSRARLVVIAFAATVAFGLMLTLAFDPQVQEMDAVELADRASDARAFLIADLFFPLLYAVLAPLALWRFGAALRAGESGVDPRPPRWVIASVVLLAGAGLCDWAENALLLIATESESQGTVDAAHAMAVPKIAFSAVGAALSLPALARAIGVLRGDAPDSQERPDQAE